MIKLTEKIGYGFGICIIHVLETVWRLSDDILYGCFRFAGCGGGNYVPDNENMGFGFRPIVGVVAVPYTLPLGKFRLISCGWLSRSASSVF